MLHENISYIEYREKIQTKQIRTQLMFKVKFGSQVVLKFKFKYRVIRYTLIFVLLFKRLRTFILLF